MSGTIYWHGGPSGLVGYLRPPSETGAPSAADFGAEKVCRRDRVYVTSNRDAAAMFAALGPSKKTSVYMVEAVGEVEHDPDTDEPGLSFQVARARILREFRMSHALREQVMAAMERTP